MLYYLIRRFTSLLLTLALSTIVIFMVMEIVPGDPALIILGIGATDETLAALREQMGLNLPLMTRYLQWVSGVLVGDLGTSYTYSVPVSELIAERSIVSIPLAIIALTLSTIIAIPTGILAASKRGQIADTGIMGLTQLGIAIPNFWFAMLMVYVFAVMLRWVPAGGFPGWDQGIFNALKSLVLPAVALALPQAAILSRVTRSALLEALGEDYIRTARAKGLTRSMVLWRHALRDALIPVLTIMGLQFAFLLAGTIIIENVFYLPGLGRLIFQAITQRDLIVVESSVVLLVASVILINFMVDIAYALVDPRLQSERS
ncbi:MAG: ABC transporter permease [Hyphomicrobiales bacterium]|nr:ABC transporter permease [Hyphomicrobiales bacterium]